MKKLCVMAVLAGFGMLAHGEKNLVANGDFTALGEDGSFKNWKHGNSVMIEMENGNRFARINNADIGGYVAISQEIPVKPDWEKLLLGVRMRVNKLDEESSTKTGDVPRAMLVFSDAKGQQQFRPLCHLGDVTNGEWIEYWQEMTITPDAEKVGLVFDMSGTPGVFDVDDVVLTANPLKLRPISVLDWAGKFQYRRTFKPNGAPGWEVQYKEMVADKPRIMIAKSGKNGFLRIINKEVGRTVKADGYFRIDPSWKKVKVSAKMRAKDLKPGPENYQDARVMFIFVDELGNRVGGYGAVPALQEDSDWRDLSVEREVPEGAAGILLQPGLHGTTGIADFDDITVEPAE